MIKKIQKINQYKSYPLIRYIKLLWLIKIFIFFHTFESTTHFNIYNAIKKSYFWPIDKYQRNAKIFWNISFKKFETKFSHHVITKKIIYKEVAQTSSLTNLPKLLKTLEITHRIYNHTPNSNFFILERRDNNSLRAQSLRVTIIDNKENKNNSPSHNSFLAISFYRVPMQFKHRPTRKLKGLAYRRPMIFSRE